MEKQIYNGFNIKFDDDLEVWYTNINEQGKQAEYDSADERLEDKSLKALKELLDKVKRKKFERMPVFVHTGYYRHGGGKDEKYLPYYIEATLTSIAPNGNAYTVEKGKKTATKSNLQYNESSIILDTPENRKIIIQFEEAAKTEWKAEREQNRLKEKLQFIDGKKVYKEVYGKELER